MRRIIQLILVFVFIGCLSCEKKEYPESIVENEAVFFVQGKVDYNAVKLVAGENDYYMYSSYALDPNSVYSFAGQFKQLGCTDCRNTLEIRIRDLKKAPGGIPNPVDSSLRIGNYPYVDVGNDVAYNITFQGSYINPTTASWRWDFGDGTYSSVLDPTHLYRNAGKYTVCFTVKDQNGCEGSVCNEINVGQNSFIASVRSVLSGDRAVQFSADVFGRAPYKYLWNFGDGNTSTIGTPLHTYRYYGSYPVTLTITDANNQTVVSKHHVVTNKDDFSCVPNIRFTAVTASIPFNTAGVVLKWTDANGETFTTDQTAQIKSSFFEILKVEEFEANEHNQKTRKLHVRFSCVMSNGKKAIPFENAQAVICVAIP